jgi:peptidoglycan L-alanyl-D-glutamate endopeptidase CwlK
MASRDKKDLRLELATAYDKACDKYKALYPNDPQPFITCTYRSGEEQNKLYNSKPKVTNAKAGQSPHNFNPSFAFDIGFIGADKKMDWNNDLFNNFNSCIQEVSDVVVWGFDWNGNKIKDKNDFDRPHFELKNWKTYIPKK